MNEHEFDRAAWENPPAAYRPIPFWSLNDVLTADELRRQLTAFAQRGFGGVFMHARIGLVTPYLGEDWFAAVRTIVDTAAALGIEAWIYDEDRWPSGYAGGRTATVPGLDYPCRGLACVAGRFEIVEAPATVNMNGVPPNNPFDRAVTQAFVELTHERYKTAIGDAFGGVCPGSFTDEPSYVLWESPRRNEVIPWTPALPDEFKARRGYDLMPCRESLFHDVGDFPRIRVDFYRTVTELFVENFTGLLNAWCREHGLLSTGHMMMEDSLLSQVQAIGAAMPHYTEMTMPGIDHLGDGIREAPLTALQAAAVAHQYGRRLLCEIWGGSSWGATVGSLKPSGDWAAALGVNFFNQHLAYYSVRGCRKRDYPNSCSYHLPGFDHYRPFNDYWGRLSYLLTRGTAVADTLVLHPMSSAWAAFRPADTRAVEALNAQFEILCRTLLEEQHGFDLGDEFVLARIGRVEGDRLRVGEQVYTTVLVPPGATAWWPETEALLAAYTAAGGRVLTVADPAALPAGLPPRAVAVRDATTGDLLRETAIQHRRRGEREVFFVSCARADRPLDLDIELTGAGAVERWHARSGRVEPLPATVAGELTKVRVQLPARGSVLLVLDRAGTPAGAPVTATRTRMPLADSWQIERLDPNVLLLDHARIRYGDSPWSPPLGVFGECGLAAVPNVHDTLATAARQEHAGARWPIAIAYEFASRCAGDVEVVVEDPRVFADARCNDRPIAPAAGQWWLDRCFAVLPAPDGMRPGLNQVVGSVHYAPARRPGTLIFTAEGTEIDNAYLRGDFHVAWDGEAGFVVEPAAALPSDPGADLTRAGLPFYVGVVRYRYRLTVPAAGPCRLHLPAPHGEGVRVRLNGTDVANLWCAPYVADLTPALVAGENELELLLGSTLANVFGTLHHVPPWSDPAHRFARYLLAPLGLGGTPEIEFG